MARLRLSFACGLYDRMQALYTGEVQPDGIDLNFLAIDDPRQIFDRMGGGQEFDLAEFSSSEFITRMASGSCPFVALPVFASRVFRHSFIFVNRSRGIARPKDLEGKRIGVPLYTQSAAIVIRGLLQHDHGVDLSTVHWVQGAINRPGAHGAPTVLPLLKPVSIEQNTSGKSLSDLLDSGEIDAITGTNVPHSMARNPDVQRLFPNFREAEMDYYRRTRIFPIMHLIAIRRALYEEHPFIATSLYNAFNKSKNIALAKMRELGALRYMLPWLPAELDDINEVFGGDPWPYGVEPNRSTLEPYLNWMVEQALIAKAMPVEDLFVPVYGQI